MYLPHTLDEEALPDAARVPVFFGGINVYLQQKVPLFRRTPAFVDRLLNSTGLLRWAARHSHMTSARDHGEMTLEMFNVGSSRLGKELDKLMAWLEHAERPDVVCLSTALLGGFAEPLKRRLGAPVVELHTGRYAHLPEDGRETELKRLADAAALDAYQNHPHHQALLKQGLAALRELILDDNLAELAR